MRGIANSVGAQSRNPKWTSYGALELDIFCPANADFETFLAAAAPLARTEFVTDLNTAPGYMTEEETLSKAKRLFNGERYWECHEVLERVWRIKQGDERRLLQGMILVCAAFVHHQKGEEAVALGVLPRAVKQLEFPEANFGGFDIPLLKRTVNEIIQSQKFWNFRF
jgi:hypothetical protein